MRYLVAGLVGLGILWPFLRLTVRDPGPQGHGSPGAHAGDGGGDGGGG